MAASTTTVFVRGSSTVASGSPLSLLSSAAFGSNGQFLSSAAETRSTRVGFPGRPSSTTSLGVPLLSQTGATTTDIAQFSSTAGPLPTSNSDDTDSSSSSNHSHGLQKKTSQYAATAVIISSVTLLLVLIAIAVVLWFYIRSRRRKRGKMGKSPAITGGENTRRQRDEEANTSRSTSSETAAVDAEGLEFNPLDMVASPPRMVTSITESRTTITNPPPPYRNNQSRSDLASPRTPIGRESSIIGPPASHSSLGDSNGRALQVPPPGGAGGRGNGVAGYDLEMAARLLPSLIAVRYGFRVTSPDELVVSKGDKLHILGVFEDGWTLCRTERGEKGVVPLACLDIPSGMQLDEPRVRTDSADGTNLEVAGEDGNATVRRSMRVESRQVVIDNVVPGEARPAPAIRQGDTSVSPEDGGHGAPQEGVVSTSTETP